MSSNSFGKTFRYTSWGESHGKGIGVVIDGCPSGIHITEEEIDTLLSLRSPGNSPFTSPRKEQDCCEILSGMHNGITTGAPISLFIKNTGFDSSAYEKNKDIFRPGHASFTYLKKYGIYDYKGGGRASARETCARVAVYAFARKVLEHHKIEIIGSLHSIGSVEASTSRNTSIEKMRNVRNNSSIYCVDPAIEIELMQKIKTALSNGDSISGSVKIITSFLPVGLGDPVYDKLSATLAYGLFSIPAVKGVSFGSSLQKNIHGSDYNDSMSDATPHLFQSNNSGGMLGGISNGMPLDITVDFKPTSSIKQPQESINHEGENVIMEAPKNGKHDPCVAIRGAIVCEAMVGITLCDFLVQKKQIMHMVKSSYP